MARHNRIILLALIMYNIFTCYHLGDAKTFLKSARNCDPNGNDSFVINLKTKTIGDVQYMNGSLLLKAPLDNTIRANVSVEMLIGKEYVYLFSINERKSCDALNKFFGELWYDLERHAQMIPGLCPISKGRYHLHDYLLDFNKMTTLNNFPFGYLRVTDFAYFENNTIFNCILAEMENWI